MWRSCCKLNVFVWFQNILSDTYLILYLTYYLYWKYDNAGRFYHPYFTLYDMQNRKVIMGQSRAVWLYIGCYFFLFVIVRIFIIYIHNFPPEILLILHKYLQATQSGNKYILTKSAQCFLKLQIKVRVNIAEYFKLSLFIIIFTHLETIYIY